MEPPVCLRTKRRHRRVVAFGGDCTDPCDGHKRAPLAYGTDLPAAGTFVLARRGLIGVAIFDIGRLALMMPLAGVQKDVWSWQRDAGRQLQRGRGQEPDHRRARFSLLEITLE